MFGGKAEGKAEEKTDRDRGCLAAVRIFESVDAGQAFLHLDRPFILFQGKTGVPDSKYRSGVARTI
jgi:hypothetical protein